MTSHAEKLMDLQAAFPYDDWAALAEQGAADDLRSALREIARDDLVTLMAGDATFRQEYAGVEGLIEAWRDWLAPFESYETAPEDMIEHGATLVLLVRQRATPKGGGPEMSNPGAAVFEFEGEKLARVEFHLDRDAVLADLGIEPS